MTSIDREASFKLMCEFTQTEGLRRHMLCVETAMRAYANRLNQDVEEWGMVGLLHDFDYERWPTPPDHPLQGAKILEQRGYSSDVIYAIKSHVDQLPDCPRVSLMDKALFACDELSGFISAVAIVRPEGINGMQASSVRKKMKQKSFAEKVNRDDIVTGAEELGIELNEHIQFVIDALAANGAALHLTSAASSTK